jgi:hypothetical protein
MRACELAIDIALFAVACLRERIGRKSTLLGTDVRKNSSQDENGWGIGAIGVV